MIFGRFTLAILAGFFSLLVLNGGLLAQETNGELIHATGTTMGTIEWKVTVNPAENPEMDEAGVVAIVQPVLDQLNDRMSTWIESSEVSRFNESQSTDWYPVSDDTAKVVVRSLEISQLSDGEFDITIAPLVELWNFGAGRGEFSLPKPELIEEKLSTVGWEKISARLNPPAIRKSNPKTRIDLSAIAKGYAVDLVAAAIQEAGFKTWFVEIGGEISVKGNKPGGSPWRVGIELPNDRRIEAGAYIEQSSGATATSGDYRNFSIVDGVRYSHEISPRTGRPTIHDLASVTVLADDCMTADGAATALIVAGPDRLPGMARQLGVKAFGFVREKDGSFSEIITSDFPEMTRLRDTTTANDNGTSPWRLMVSAAVIVGLAIAGLAIGALFANKPLKGSCGGVANDAGSCGTCGGTIVDCVEPRK